jgi:hypothetical protein
MSIYYMECFLYFLQNILGEWTTKLPKVIIVTRGIFLLGDQSPTSPSTAPILGMFRVFLSENRPFAKFIDLSPDEQSSQLDAQQIISELWSEEPQPMIAYRGGSRHILKLVNSPRLGLPYPPLSLDTSAIAKR